MCGCLQKKTRRPSMLEKEEDDNSQDRIMLEKYQNKHWLVIYVGVYFETMCITLKDWRELFYLFEQLREKIRTQSLLIITTCSKHLLFIYISIFCRVARFIFRRSRWHMNHMILGSDLSNIFVCGKISCRIWFSGIF